MKKLGAAASEARRQRDELLQHMELLSKEASAARAACQRAQASASLAGASPLATMPTSCHVPASHEQHALVEELRQQVAKLAAAVQTRDAELLQLRTQYDDPQKAVSASDGGEAGKAASQGNPETNAQAPSVPYKEVVSMAAALDELRQEREQSMSQVEVIAAQMHGLRARADAAEERVRLSEARCAAIEETHKVTDGELRRLQEQHAPQQAEIRRLTSELAAAQDRAALAESTLREERTRRDASKRDAADRSNASSLAETALAAQVRALAAQLQAAKGDAAAARQELRSLQGQAQGQSAAAEGATASLLSANRELEAALSTAADDLQARMAEVQEARATVAHLSSENAALHAALKDRATELGHATAAAAEGRRKVDALEAQVVSLQRDLRVAQGKVVQLEDAMARSGGGVAGSGPSPLRDVVGTLRNELQDRELRLATAEEELAAERRRAAELHRQALDQVRYKYPYKGKKFEDTLSWLSHDLTSLLCDDRSLRRLLSWMTCSGSMQSARPLVSS